MDAGILIGLRLGLYLSLGLLAGVPLYRWLVARERLATARAPIVMLALVAALLSCLWLLASAAAMGGTAIIEPDWPTIGLLLGATNMGWALILRLLALALICVLPPRPVLLAVPASAAMATLAWTGHAAATEGNWGNIHIVSDVLHMLAAAIWLAALFHFLRGVMRGGVDRTIAPALSRFAWPGTIIVAVLVATGVYNLAMITGLDLYLKPDLSPYEQLLAAKVVLFAAMLGLAAANRWLFTPAMQSAPGRHFNGVRISLAVETTLLVAIVCIVAVLGTLDPLA